MRFLAPIAIGLLLAAAFIACFVDPNPPPDPNPPDPRGNQSSEPVRAADAGDGGEADR